MPSAAAEGARFDLVLKGGTCVTPGGVGVADIGIRQGRIEAIGALDAGSAAAALDCRGLHVLPGVIDSQVHFREPGLEHKEDLATGTAAAAMGGVTAVFDMPNTKPPTLTKADLADKCRRAKGRAWVDIAFWVGAAAENVGELAELEGQPAAAGVKMFVGSSTGSLLVADEATIARVLAAGKRRLAVHAEDEGRLKERFVLVAGGADPERHPEWRDATTALLATQRVLALARGIGRRIHLLHVSTADELVPLRNCRDLATVEVTPQHLTLVAPDCYRRLGTRAQMNPPIRDRSHRAALWQAVNEGLVDCIGSDHAPHTLEEKAQPYPNSPSGMPGVQTLVPVMLNHVAAGRLTLERFVDLTAAGPARCFGICGYGRIAAGYHASLTLVDLAARRTITDRWIVSRCGWTPFDGLTVTGWPVATLVRGRIVMREGQLIGPPAGEAITFLEAL